MILITFAFFALIVDEADKAPLEVVAILKSLAEDGELALPDGRRLLRQDRWLHEYNGRASVDFEPAEAAAANNVILIHEDFRLIVLANRPGMVSECMCMCMCGVLCVGCFVWSTPHGSASV